MGGACSFEGSSVSDEDALAMLPNPDIPLVREEPDFHWQSPGFDDCECGIAQSVQIGLRGSLVYVFEPTPSPLAVCCLMVLKCHAQDDEDNWWWAVSTLGLSKYAIKLKDSIAEAVRSGACPAEQARSSQHMEFYMEIKREDVDFSSDEWQTFLPAEAPKNAVAAGMQNLMALAHYEIATQRMITSGDGIGNIMAYRHTLDDEAWAAPYWSTFSGLMAVGENPFEGEGEEKPDWAGSVTFTRDRSLQHLGPCLEDLAAQAGSGAMPAEAIRAAFQQSLRRKDGCHQAGDPFHLLKVIPLTNAEYDIKRTLAPMLGLRGMHVLCVVWHAAHGAGILPRLGWWDLARPTCAWADVPRAFEGKVSARVYEAVVALAAARSAPENNP